MKKLIILVVGCFSVGLLGQDGKLIARQQLRFPDSIQQQFNESPVFSGLQSATEVSRITYLSDNLKINGYIARPKKPGTYPVIIFNRGGNRDFGALNDRRALYILGTMASWGYVVAASQYRGGGGSEGMEEFGGKEVKDILNLIPLLSDDPMADISRMGVYGFSRGGMMTYLLLRQSCAFKAAIVGGGPTNLPKWIDKRPEMETGVYAELIPEYYKNKAEELKKRSAFYWADELCKTTPLLLLHGSADWRVAPENSLEMVEELHRLKHPVRFLFLEGAQHGLSEYRKEVWSSIRSFFDRYVRDKKPLPNMEPHGN